MTTNFVKVVVTAKAYFTGVVLSFYKRFCLFIEIKQLRKKFQAACQVAD